MIKYSFVLFFVLISQTIMSITDTAIELLHQTSTWMYQIQNIDEDSVNILDQTNDDLLVIEPTYTIQDEEDFDIKSAISKLKTKPDQSRRLVFAYIDIGQAEDYRTYWQSHWIAPTEDSPGKPRFLISLDPDGWEGNYPVAFWKRKWRKIWFGKNGLIQELAQLGFDGVYLDWIEVYEDNHVVKYARSKDVDTTQKIFKFLKKIKKNGRAINEEFLLIAQNAPYLIDEDQTKYLDYIDAIAIENIWFMGDSDANWNDAEAGDISNPYNDEYSTNSLIIQCQKIQSLGLPVFTVDYCVNHSNAQYVYQNSTQLSFIPLVTRVSLSELTDHPSNT